MSPFSFSRLVRIPAPRMFAAICSPHSYQGFGDVIEVLLRKQNLLLDNIVGIVGNRVRR